MVEEKRFFSDARREFIARAIMDMVKLITVAAVVSGFFLSPISIHLRLMGCMGLLVAFSVSVVLFPRKGGA